MDARWPRQFMRTLGRARLTIAASASCMRNLQSIDDLRKLKEEPIPSRWWKTTCFSFVWSQKRRGYNTARIQQERSWTRHACCIDRPIWSMNDVQMLSDCVTALFQWLDPFSFNCCAVPQRWQMLVLLPDNNVEDCTTGGDVATMLSLIKVCPQCYA